MSEVLEAIRDQGIIAIIRAPGRRQAQQSLDVLIESTLRVLEVSLVTPDAFDVIRKASATAPEGIHIGVGTVLTADEVRRAATAGARFVVSPTLNERVLKESLDRGLDCVPGVATPTEAMQAGEWGATLVKLFPASLWSPGALREVLTALPELQVVPTGGVSVESAAEWIRAGATALGIGGSLTRASNPAATVRRLIGAISEARTDRLSAFN